MIKKTLNKGINALRKSTFRKYFLNFGIFLNNFSYRIIKLFITAPDEIHPKHEIIKYHKFFTDNVSTEDTVIDIGCGNGANAYDIAQKARKVIGIDINEKNINFAKKKYSRDNLEFIAGDATTYAFDKKFDKIALSNVLEHIEHRIDFLKKLHNVSDVILLRVPMLTRDWLSVFKKQQGFEYRLDTTHFTEYSLEQIKEELGASGWKIGEYSIQFGEFWGVIHKA